MWCWWESTSAGEKTAELLGAAAILLATVGYAIGPMIVKHRLSDVDPLGPVTAALLIATVLLAPVAVVDWPTEVPSGEALASVAMLGVVCSALAFLLFFALIAEVGPARATVITYVNPTVALALGLAVLGEQVTAGAIAGLLLILAGSWLATDGRLPPGLAAVVGRLPLRGAASRLRARVRQPRSADSRSVYR